MGTSETYIRMCEKAEEIQGNRTITQWDYYTINETNLIFNFRPDELVGHYLLPEVWIDEVSIYVPQYIWLPRQDQLQEMVGGYTTQKDMICGYGYADNEYGEFMGVPDEYWDGFTSMEQLWLTFVMKEKYNKIWNGEEWVSGTI